MNKIQSLKGTRDFYPEIMAVRSWLYRQVAQVSQSYGYQEYEGPFLEKLELYAAKSGEELVKEQAFVFADRGGDMITLRPELTPTLARMVAQKQAELAYPLRWWSFGPFWRYERPQKGRTREFFQWNIDLIGSSTVEADAELVAIAASFLKSTGLKPSQVQLLVNNRRLMDAQFTKLGVTPETKPTMLRLIDRRDKMTAEAWLTYALESGLSLEQFEGLKALLSNPDLWLESDELRRLFELLTAMGLSEYIRFDPQIIRGLDYYTGTVFEAKDLDGGRSILGGGRYDNLVGAVGGEPVSGVGFAMGDVMITIVLEKYGLIPALSTCPSAVLVTVFDDASLVSSFALSAELRSAGINVVTYPEAAKLQKQLKLADRLGLQYALIAGPDEQTQGTVMLKDLRNRAQESVSRVELAQRLRLLLA